MNQKSKIEFLEEGTEVVIIFQNGRRSVEFTSKEEAFEAIKEMAEKKKITVGEFKEFRDAILEQKNLPWSDEPKRRAHIIAVQGPFLGFSLMDMLLSDKLEENKVKETTFKMCEKNSNHGHIYVCNKGILKDPVFNKVQGCLIVKSLESDGDIDQKDADKLLKQIEESSLPVDMGNGSNNSVVN